MDRRGFLKGLFGAAVVLPSIAKPTQFNNAGEIVQAKPAVVAGGTNSFSCTMSAMPQNRNTQPFWVSCSVFSPPSGVTVAGPWT
jgi:hypothetical protein